MPEGSCGLNAWCVPTNKLFLLLLLLRAFKVENICASVF